MSDRHEEQAREWLAEECCEVCSDIRLHKDVSLAALLRSVAAEARREEAEKLDQARAALLQAMDALESDSDLPSRRSAYDFAVEQFENLSDEDNERADKILWNRGVQR